MAGKIQLSNYAVGTVVRAAAARVEKEKTSPPPYFTEASLLEEMVNAHKYATSEGDREMLQLTQGIGTARTRGEILKDLLRNAYLIKEGKETKKGKGKAEAGTGKKMYIKDSAAGRQLSKLAPSALKNVTLTAKWEILFSKIEAGEITHEQFKQVIRQFVEALVGSVRQLKEKGGVVWNHADATKRK